MNENGVTRREFEQLVRRIDYLDEHGSRRVGVIEAKLQVVEEKVDAVQKAVWWLIGVLATGLITLVVALTSGALQ